MKKTRYIAKIEQPIKGTALYRTEGGATVFLIHYSSDDAKDEAWVRKNAALTPGGVSSPQWQQEMELDDQVERGERTYQAFDRSRNIIEPRPVEPHWAITLAFDFGQTNPTAVIFIAQDPLTRECFVFDSVYRPKGIDPAVTYEVYEKLSKHRNTSPKEMRQIGIDRFIERAIGDPSGASYAAYYAQCAFPISIATKMEGIKFNDHEAGESHVNAGLTPRIVCCGAVQYNPNPGQEAEAFNCGLCGKAGVPTPSIYVMDGRAEELCDQWETLIRKLPVVSDIYGELETPEVDMNLPNHASDAARYGFFFINFEPEEMAPITMRSSRLDVLQAKAENKHLEPHEEIELMVLEKYVDMEQRKESEEMGYTRGMFLTDHHQKRGPARFGYGGYLH